MSIDRRRGAICGTHETLTVVSAFQCPVCALARAEARVKELEAENKRLREEIEWFLGKGSTWTHIKETGG